MVLLQELAVVAQWETRCQAVNKHRAQALSPLGDCTIAERGGLGRVEDGEAEGGTWLSRESIRSQNSTQAV